MFRNVTADDGQINEVIESVKQRGFINYYGLQRFGSSVVAPTHVIGKTILQKNWKEVCSYSKFIMILLFFNFVGSFLFEIRKNDFALMKQYVT